MDALNANMEAARLLLAKDGGVHLNPARKSSWQAVNQETNDASTVSAPSLSIGAWQSAPEATQGPLRQISDATGRASVLFERINPEGDMMLVGGAAAEIGAHTALGTYIPARLPGDEPNPVLQTILGGQVYRGRLYLQGSWHTVVCDPLRQGAGDVYGMVCVGLNNSGIRSLEAELKANYVGTHGSVAVFMSTAKIAGSCWWSPPASPRRRRRSGSQRCWRRV